MSPGSVERKSRHRITSATTANAPKMYRECSPSDMLNAAPGLYASVKRTNSPTTGCGMCSGWRKRTARIFVRMSRAMITPAVVQNARPLLSFELMLRCVFLQLPRLTRYGRRSWYRHSLGLGVFTPQHPRQEESAKAHRHVGDVERRPSRIAESDVDEVYYALLVTHAIDEIADRAATDERERQRPRDVTAPRRHVEPAKNGERDDGQDHEDPARVFAHVQAERRAGIVDEVDRSHPPNTSRDRCGIPNRLTANAFVQKSIVATSTSTGQNSPELLLCIFLTLLAINAIPRMRQCVQPFERNLIAALVAAPESFG